MEKGYLAAEVGRFPGLGGEEEGGIFSGGPNVLQLPTFWRRASSPLFHHLQTDESLTPHPTAL